MKKVFFVATLLLSSIQFYATPDSWEEILETVLIEDDIPEWEIEQMCEELEILHSTPININTATIEELSQLPFLSGWQIENIHEYIYLHGQMQTLGELQLVGGIDYHTRELLKHFFYAAPVEVKKEISAKDVFKYGRQEIVSRIDVPMYKRDGFLYHSQEELERYPNRKYMGSPYSHNIRYSFNYNNKIRFGITADTDAGEPFFGKNRYGYDFYSPYIQIKDMWGFNNIVAGNLKANIGYGLMANSGFSLGKSMSISAIDRGNTGFRPHSSVSEQGYYSGVAMVRSIGKINVSVMAAHTPTDATLKTDTLISSFKTDGYHRTPLEWQKKRNVSVNTLYAGISRNYNGTVIGVNAIYERCSLPTAYGTVYKGVSGHYSIRRSKYHFAGETSFSGNFAFATLNTLSLKLSNNLDLQMLYRFYSPQYRMLHANAFAEGAVTNEEGLYTAITYKWRKLKLIGYIDKFHHPKPTSRASLASDGVDTKLQIEWKNTDEMALKWSVKYKSKQQDHKDSGTMQYKQTLRSSLQWKQSFGTICSLQSTFNYSCYSFPANSYEHGFGLTESVSVQPSEKLSGNITFHYFNTDSYSSSVSIYEKGLLYGFNYQTLSGSGMRLAAQIKYSFTNSLYIMAKFGATKYFDRETIGSLQQQIHSSHKEDLSLQLRYKF